MTIVEVAMPQLAVEVEDAALGPRDLVLLL
jgi:hypothetical protein